jgi:hypothetical protein
LFNRGSIQSIHFFFSVCCVGSGGGGAMASAEIDWATYGLPDLRPPPSSMGDMALAPRGSNASAWNALHGFGDFQTQDNNANAIQDSTDSPRSSASPAPRPALVFACAECPEAFATRRDLTVHKKTHAMDRPFQCCNTSRESFAFSLTFLCF